MGALITRRSNTSHIASLTGVRFFAIMIIVFSHFEFLKEYDGLGEIYWKFFHNATLGVDFFFMLSGFGMMLSSMKKDPLGDVSVGGLYGLIDFGKRHIKKIYPVYVAFLVIGIPYLFLQDIEMGRPLYVSFIRLLYFPLDLTLLQAATGRSSLSHSLNGVCWFLSCLFCIYLVSPLIMKYLKKYVKTNREIIIGIILSVISSCIFAVILRWFEQLTLFDDLCYGSPYRRVFYVVMGMLIARLFVFNKDNSSVWMFKSCLFEYCSILCSVCWFFLRNISIGFLGAYIYIIDMVLVGCDLLALALGKGVFSKILSSYPMVYLGSISMYIFLSHYNIRMYTDYVVRVLNVKSMIVAVMEVVSILVLTFLISAIIHRYRTKRI